jgi:hypothetical protein
VNKLSEATLKRLSQAENFKTWNFGRIEKALSALRAQTKLVRDHDVVFPEGEQPWEGEPDKVQWIDPTTGYDCLILRNPLGALCGYVGVPPTHPFHGVDYGSCPEDCDEKWCSHRPDARVQVHGGITFNDFCDPAEEGERICHVPAEGRPDKVWWFGFDCAHAFDLAPGMIRFRIEEAMDTYRDITYAVGEIDGLALQLKEIEGAG